MTHSVESSAGEFPVFEGEPLYLRVTLVFPYTKGLLFQNAVYGRLGKASFLDVFRHAPVSTQQILHPDTYFSGLQPTKPTLPELPDAHGYKDIADGTVGELDHSILLEQYCGKEESTAVSPHWRGGDYALLENRATRRVVLQYASEWDDASSAARYFRLYRQVLQKKWKHIDVQSETDSVVSGVGDDGYFRLELHGALFTSLEGAENPIEPVR
jgi:hypothetical protein